MEGWLPLVIMIGLGATVGIVGVALSSLLGPKKPTAEKAAPYECGVPPVGDARERQSVKFYLVAMIFLLFDIEVAFLYPWAMALRDLGWAGFVQILVFFAAAARRLRLHLAQGRARLGEGRTDLTRRGPRTGNHGCDARAWRETTGTNSHGSRTTAAGRILACTPGHRGSSRTCRFC